MIRPMRPEDCGELAALYAANREFLAPFEPVRPPEFFTADGQRERLRRQLDGETHPFAILDGEAIAGTINVFSIVRDGPESCTIGYWVDGAVAGRSITPTALAVAIDHCFGAVGLHRVEVDIRSARSSRSRSAISACTASRPPRSSTTSRRSACSRRTASSGSALRGGSSASAATGATSSSTSDSPTTDG